MLTSAALQSQVLRKFKLSESNLQSGPTAASSPDAWTRDGELWQRAVHRVKFKYRPEDWGEANMPASASHHEWTRQGTLLKKIVNKWKLKIYLKKRKSFLVAWCRFLVKKDNSNMSRAACPHQKRQYYNPYWRFFVRWRPLVAVVCFWQQRRKSGDTQSKTSTRLSSRKLLSVPRWKPKVNGELFLLKYIMYIMWLILHNAHNNHCFNLNHNLFLNLTKLQPYGYDPQYACFWYNAMVMFFWVVLIF